MAMQNYTRYPEEIVVDRFYSVLSASAILITRAFLVGADTVTKTVTFYKNETIADFAKKEIKYSVPAVFVKLGDRVDDSPKTGTIENIITMLVVVDSTFSAPTQLLAEQESRRLSRNIKQVMYDVKYWPDIRILDVKSFLVNPNVNCEKHQVTWRTYFEIEFR
jgi:hypothetical protein